MLARARSRGVDLVLVPGTDLESSRSALRTARSEEGVWAAAGLHPHDARLWNDETGRELESLLSDPRTVAMGEIGLDFHYDLSPREDQLRVFERQLAIAKGAGLPVILHNRESGEAMIETLRKPEHAGLRGVFHSFCDSPEVAREALALGFHVGYSGMITFRQGENVRATAVSIPEERLLVETDSPYLAPVPFRGKTNEPAFVELVLRKLAEIRSVAPEELAERIRRNFLGLFAKVAAAAGEAGG